MFSARSFSPGPKPYTGRDSVMTAISAAQPNPMAWLERIQVIRPSGDEKVKAKIFEVDFDRMAAHGELGKNVLLQEGDIIYVPPTILAAVGKKYKKSWPQSPALPRLLLSYKEQWLVHLQHKVDLNLLCWQT